MLFIKVKIFSDACVKLVKLLLKFSNLYISGYIVNYGKVSSVQSVIYKVELLVYQTIKKLKIKHCKQI